VRGKGEKHQRKRTSEDRIKNPVGGEARDPRERKGGDGCVALLGRSHQGSPEAEDTLTMISHGVEISIAGGGADEKDEGKKGAEPRYIEGNPSTAFATRLIPQYESHIGVTKETIQFVVTLQRKSLIATV